MVEFNRATLPPREKIMEAFGQVLDRGVLTNNGPVVRELEEALRKVTGSPFSLTTANGTLSLHMAVRALGLRGQVITSPLTFVASSSCMIWEGARPVFADVDPDTLCLDPASVRDRMHDGICGLLPVHLYGHICDIDELEGIAAGAGIPTIYDGAQAFGCSYKGRSALACGTVTMLSLHAYKIVSAVEGGALFTASPELYSDLYRMRYFGKEADNTEVMLGTNAKMNEFNAAFGLATLAVVDAEIAARKANYVAYRDALSGNTALHFPDPGPHTGWNYAYTPVLFESEELLLEALERGGAQGVQLRRYFYPAVNAIGFLGFDPQETPVAWDISKRIACLPNYSGLRESERDQVVNLLNSLLN